MTLFTVKKIAVYVCRATAVFLTVSKITLISDVVSFHDNRVPLFSIQVRKSNETSLSGLSLVYFWFILFSTYCILHSAKIIIIFLYL